jgi:Rieske Fe-S protein
MMSKNFSSGTYTQVIAQAQVPQPFRGVYLWIVPLPQTAPLPQTYRVHDIDETEGALTKRMGKHPVSLHGGNLVSMMGTCSHAGCAIAPSRTGTDNDAARA